KTLPIGSKRALFQLLAAGFEGARGARATGDSRIVGASDGCGSSMCGRSMIVAASDSFDEPIIVGASESDVRPALGGGVCTALAALSDAEAFGVFAVSGRTRSRSFESAITPHPTLSAIEALETARIDGSGG